MQEAQEPQVRSLGQEDPLDKEIASHSSILACKIPWTEEPAELQSMRSQRVRHDWPTKHMPVGLINGLAVCVSHSVMSDSLWPMDCSLPCPRCLCPCVSPGKSTGSEVKSLSHVRLFATPWIVAYQSPPSMGFSRQEYWRGLPNLCSINKSNKNGIYCPNLSQQWYHLKHLLSSSVVNVWS